jgi:ribose/xylose/arabinose/galactoside ABC-type transport system permease subunit
LAGATSFAASGRWRRRVSAADAWVAASAVLYALAVLPLCPELASLDQAAAIVTNAAPLAILAVGQLWVLLIGEIDLSVPGVVSLTGVIGAYVMSDQHGLLAGSPWAVLAGFGAMALVAICIGALQGAAVARLQMPAFLVTMSTMMALGGAAVWMTGGERLGELPQPLLDLMQGEWLGAPAIVWLAAGMAIGAHAVLQHTVAGKYMYALGHSRLAAHISGVPVGRTTIVAFTLSTVFSAAAAMVYMCRAESATPAFNRDVLMDAIAAAVIGGASLGGGRASTLGVVCGALFITLIGNSLTLMNLDYWHVLMAKGAIILVAAIVDAARRRILGRTASL